MFVKIKTFHRKKIVAVFALCMAAMLFLIGRLGYLMLLRADYYSEKAQDLHERERSIKAARGKILDCNGKVLADNKTVYDFCDPQSDQRAGKSDRCADRRTGAGA